MTVVPLMRPSPTSAKPPLTVFVVGSVYEDTIDTLKEALGLPRWVGGWPPHGRHIDCEKHTLHLRPDVHRGHDGACALLVVRAVTGVDADVRLAVLHARRAGLHRFVVLVDEHGTRRRGEAVERDVRHLLADLDVDADAVPVIRAPLYRFGKTLSAATRAGVHELLAALDDLPAFADPVPLHAVPPALAGGAQLLDEVLSLFAPGTLLCGDGSCSLADSYKLRGGSGGSYMGGAPYFEHDEPWPHCPRCDRPMSGLFQIDVRDFLHEVPPGHGLFVVFTCDDEACAAHEVRHHPDPCAERRQLAPPVGRTQLTDYATIFGADGRCWTLPEPELLAAEHPSAAARLHALAGGDPVAAFTRVAACIGANNVGHRFGGHHITRKNVPTPHCRVCGALCLVVATLRPGWSMCIPCGPAATTPPRASINCTGDSAALRTSTDGATADFVDRPRMDFLPGPGPGPGPGLALQY